MSVMPDKTDLIGSPVPNQGKFKAALGLLYDYIVGLVKSDDPRLVDARVANGGNAATVGGKYASDFAPNGFGFGGISTNVILENIDINNIKTSSRVNVSPSCKNIPIYGGYFYLDVLPGATLEYSKQVAMDMNSPFSTYVRTCNSNVWQPWQELAIASKTTYITASGSGTNYYWRKWSNGDIEQWVRGVANTGLEIAQTITLPVQFSNSCNFCQVTTTTTGVITDDAMYQLLSRTVSQVVVYKQVIGNNLGNTIPEIYCIGR